MLCRDLYFLVFLSSFFSSNIIEWNQKATNSPRFGAVRAGSSFRSWKETSFPSLKQKLNSSLKTLKRRNVWPEQQEHLKGKQTGSNLGRIRERRTFLSVTWDLSLHRYLLGFRQDVDRSSGEQMLTQHCRSAHLFCLMQNSTTETWHSH